MRPVISCPVILRLLLGGRKPRVLRKPHGALCKEEKLLSDRAERLWRRIGECKQESIRQECALRLWVTCRRKRRAKRLNATEKQIGKCALLCFERRLSIGARQERSIELLRAIRFPTLLLMGLFARAPPLRQGENGRSILLYGNGQGHDGERSTVWRCTRKRLRQELSLCKQEGLLIAEV